MIKSIYNSVFPHRGHEQVRKMAFLKQLLSGTMKTKGGKKKEKEKRTGS